MANWNKCSGGNLIVFQNEQPKKVYYENQAKPTVYGVEGYVANENEIYVEPGERLYFKRRVSLSIDMQIYLACFGRDGEYIKRWVVSRDGTYQVPKDTYMLRCAYNADSKPIILRRSVIFKR